jgi:hypothetical protein
VRGFKSTRQAAKPLTPASPAGRGNQGHEHRKPQIHRDAVLEYQGQVAACESPVAQLVAVSRNFIRPDAFCQSVR